MTFHRSNTMRYITLAAGLAISASAFGFTFAGDGGTSPRQTLTAQQHNGEAPLRSAADLRAAGPAGLREILAAFDRNPESVSESDIDAVAQQHDARWSRLYWYTDLDAAKSVARTERKPILYLRMLGKLTDEYSCANSRFFRTALYANESVSHLLRERFVLVWQSERPVPVATIDYGDGRILKRTITGNSIHYVLDAEGTVVDALPGLYDPETFAHALAAAHNTAMSGVESKRRDHLETVARSLGQMWEWEIKQAGFAAPAPVRALGAKIELETPLIAGAGGQPTPDARVAMNRAMTKRVAEARVVEALVPAAPPPPNARAGAGMAEAKMRAELPMVRALTPADSKATTAPVRPPAAANAGQQAFGKMMLESPIITQLEVSATPAAPPEQAADSLADAASPIWTTLAARRVESVRLDSNSIALIRAQNPRAYANSRTLERVLEQFRRSIAADTVRNEYLFRRQIIAWLKDAPTPIALEDLNQRVYAELFLTPRSDPWLGLVPEATYSALQDDGMCATK